MPLILPANTISAAAYSVDNSCRFNDADSPKLTITPGSAGNVDKWTLSMWIKRGDRYTNQTLFLAYTSSGNYTMIRFQGGGATFPNCILFENYVGGAAKGVIKTNAGWRDQAAWYHFVFVWDSGNATAGNRMRIYANGAEVTSLGVDTNPDEDQDSHVCAAVEHTIGAGNSGGGEFFHGYMAEVCLCDGQTLTPSDFGEFDSDSPTIWKPKDVSGLTFGTTGFYLDFEASDNLGNDANGGTDLTEANLDATDQATDTPTNNFATWNPLWRWALDNDTAYSEGNVNASWSTASDRGFAFSTIGVSAGQWYWEIKVPTTGRTYTGVGDADVVAGINQGPWDETGTGASYSLTIRHSTGDIQTEGSTETAYTDDGADDDIIMWALDMDNNRVWHGLNGTWSDSGDPTSGATGTGDLTTQIGTQVHLTQSDFIAPCVADPSTAGGSVSQGNFGGCPGFAISSGNADANGYGNFEYAPPSGFLALCTKNLGSDGG